jgi:hypothetical protein
MTVDIPDARCKVLQFPCKTPAANCLTKQDKQDIRSFRGLAEAAGYDAISIHIVSNGTGQGTMDYVSSYRPDEAWSTWGFAREGDVIVAWSALTLKDVGRFSTLWEALACVLVSDIRMCAKNLSRPSQDRHTGTRALEI